MSIFLIQRAVGPLSFCSYCAKSCLTMSIPGKLFIRISLEFLLTNAIISYGIEEIWNDIQLPATVCYHTEAIQLQYCFTANTTVIPILREHAGFFRVLFIWCLGKLEYIWETYFIISWYIVRKRQQSGSPFYCGNFKSIIKC